MYDWLSDAHNTCNLCHGCKTHTILEIAIEIWKNYKKWIQKYGHKFQETNGKNEPELCIRAEKTKRPILLFYEGLHMVEL